MGELSTPKLQRCHGLVVPASPAAKPIGGRMIHETCMACQRFVPWSKPENLYQPPTLLRKGETCRGRVISCQYS